MYIIKSTAGEYYTGSPYFESGSDDAVKFTTKREASSVVEGLKKEDTSYHGRLVVENA